MLSLQAKQLNVRLVLEVEPHLQNVWCDKTLIEQVIINLARNGMQAMDLTSTQERVLTLFAFACGSTQVKFQVRDQGSGLSPEISTRLFTPFFTTKPEGMGLGLSLCRTVIEQHGGSLNYTTVTQPPLTGTAFSFKLMTHHATTA
jgi:two-component system sensor histidine kinase DctS